MLPAFCLLRIGRGRGFTFPFPVFLLWPLVGLAWLLVTLARIVVPRGSSAGQSVVAAGTGLAVLGHLSGLHIDVAAAGGEKVRIRFI